MMFNKDNYIFPACDRCKCLLLPDEITTKIKDNNKPDIELCKECSEKFLNFVDGNTYGLSIYDVYIFLKT